MQGTRLIAALLAGTAATVTMAAIVPSEADVSISPMMAVTGFTLYEPPDRFEHSWYDYMQSASGGPSPGNKPTAYPTDYQKYPYRAVFFGGYENRNNQQGYDSAMFVVYSKVPASDIFTFAYEQSRGTYGNIRATAKSMTKLGWDDDDECVVVYNSWGGVSSGQVNIYHYAFSTYVTYREPYYFDFDFYYQDCGALQMNGLGNLTNVPYGYILTCKNLDGTGGGSQSGSSSSGSGGSSGGGSSGREIPSGVPGGAGSISVPDDTWDDWKTSSGGGSNPGKYPWEDEKNIPEKDWKPTIPDYPGGSEDDNRNNDVWQTPEYTPPDLPFTDDDINIPKMPDVNFPSVPIPDFQFPGIDYQPEVSGSWPPPFPGTN